MSTGPITPSPTPRQFPSMGLGPLKDKVGYYEKMRLAIFSNLTGILPLQVEDEVRLIKANARDITGTERQEDELKTALVKYLEFILKNDAGQKEIADFVIQVQNRALTLFGTDLQKEQLPTILANLLTQPNQQRANALGQLTPFTTGGKLTLNLSHPADKRVNDLILAKDKWQIVSAFQAIYTTLNPQERPTKVEMSLDQIGGAFDTREQLREFLEGWFTRELQAKPDIGDDLVAVLTPVKLTASSPSPPAPLLVGLTRSLAPRIVDQLLSSLTGETLTKIIDHSAARLKTHLDSLRKTENEIGKVKKEIDWLRKGLLNGSIQSIQELQNFSLNVWGQDLFALSQNNRKIFFDTQLSKDREEHYLQEAHFRIWGLEPVMDPELQAFRKALFADSIPADQLKELNKTSRKLWDIDFKEIHKNLDVEKRYLVMIPAYKKALQKEMAQSVAEVFGAYVGSLITPDLIKETIIDFSNIPNSPWSELERSFPPASQLRRQLEEGVARKEDLINFLPFLKEGLPELFKGAIQLSLEQQMVSDVLSVKWINQMIEETLLPTAIDAIHGVMISRIINNHRHLLLDAIAYPIVEANLIAMVQLDYEELIREEGLSIPPGVDVGDVVRGSLKNLRTKMKDLLARGYDPGTLRLGMIEFLKDEPKVPSPGENKDVYPELILTALFDLVGLPPYLKGVLQSTPGYPYAASQLSKAVTSSIAPYREGHGELVRVLTSLFTDLIQPKTEKRLKPLPPQRSLEEQVADISKVTVALIKQQVGANEGLSRYAFKYLPVESIVSTLFNRGLEILKHPMIRDPLYHHKGVIILMGGAK